MPEFIELDEFPSAPRRKPGTPHIQPHPCANCARQVVSATARKTYCSDLCSQVASWIRYFQKAKADGRILLPDVHEALGIKLALIAGGGYAKTERELPPELREEIKKRDGGMCRSCGSPGTDIDHIQGSSPDPSNLQLLCRECHNAKTQSLMVAAAPDLVESVHRPIQRRAVEIPHRQPCDTTDWHYNLWIKGSLEVSTALQSLWATWLAGPGSVELNPAVAVAGFPGELDPWSWYLGAEPVADPVPTGEEWRTSWPEGGIPFTIGDPLDEESAALQRAAWERNQRFLEESERRRVIADLRTISHARPFRRPIAGKGKWHTSYADVEGSAIPEWVTNAARTPACGNRTVELNLLSEPFYPALGEKRSKYTDRLCGNCLRIQ